MLDKGFVERFLRLNNVSASSSDEEIKTALGQAKWSEAEINTALTLLRDQSLGSSVVAVSKGQSSIFRPDFDWSSEELSALLGVDVVVDPNALRKSSAKLVRKRHMANVVAGVFVVLLAFVLALSIGAFVAYSLGAGPFHESIEQPIL